MTKKTILVLLSVVLVLFGGGWILSRVMNGAAFSEDTKVFASLQDPTLPQKLFKDSEGVEHQLEEVFPFRLGNQDLALAVFATYRLDDKGERLWSHAEAPMVGVAVFRHLPEGSWRCLDFRPEFQQHGAFGNMGEVSLVFLGPDRPTLVLTGGFTGQGVSVSGSSYHLVWHPEGRLDLSEVLSLGEDFDNSDSGLFDTIVQVQAKTEILTANVKNGWYPVRITHSGTAERNLEKVEEELAAAGEARAEVKPARRVIHESVTFTYDSAEKSYQPDIQPNQKLDGWWKGGEAVALEHLLPDPESNETQPTPKP